MSDNLAHVSSQSEEGSQNPPPLLLPKAPVLTVAGKSIYWLTPEGEITEPSAETVHLMLAQTMPIVCHAPFTAKKLGIDRFVAYDILELFAFIHPGEFCLPTPDGVAQALDIFTPNTEKGGEKCTLILNILRHLLLDLQARPTHDEQSDPVAIAWMMGMCDAGNPQQAHNDGWPWAKTVLHALGTPNGPDHSARARAGLRVWHKLPEWSEHAPEPASGHLPVTADEAQERLTALLDRHSNSELRPQQSDYVSSVTPAFAPTEAEDSPNIVLAEAGTGVGKTLGYLSPATVWAEKNEGTVWISTFTRNLQRQIDQEMSRLYPDDIEKSRKVVVRKGRENYLCLLNLEDAVNSPAIRNNGLNATAIGLMARWAAVSRDGDLMGGDFPGWLASLLGWGRTYGLSDRRGECIYAACDHYHKCFVEKSVRKSKHAQIVIANHALVMMQTALAGMDDTLPNRYVFDEGHHLFEAADSAFSAQLSGTEAADLRRWILGAETGKKSRARGLRRRIEDIIEKNEDANHDLDTVIEVAKSLPNNAWRQRLYDGKPRGVTENFLQMVRAQVYARNQDRAQNHAYSLETDVHPVIDGLAEAAYALSLRLNDLKQPLLRLVRVLQKMLVDHADTLETETRQRIESVSKSILRRADFLSGWIAMLKTFNEAADEDFVDWFAVERVDGRDYDVGMFRHYIDPAIPFSQSIKPHVQGMLVTSATLRDNTGEAEADWHTAEKRTGAVHLATQADTPTGTPTNAQTNTPPNTAQSTAPNLTRTAVNSPFNYAEQSRILVVRDVNKNDPKQVAAAYRELFLASGGGALGLFTAISRMKMTYDHLIDPLSSVNIPLYAQHLEGLDVSTLIDMFRMEEDACLLGTDATRDGMDVPGRSLRMIVFDRVPWPRPTILHKARRTAFGRGYDDMQTRFRLKQAYGRLIRKQNDRGLFVMLDPSLPTRLCQAFPEDVEIERIGLSEAIEITKTFLNNE